MSVTLRSIAFTHIDRFSGSDRATTSDLSVQDVIFRIRMICNELLKPEYITKYQDNDRSAIAQCIVSYELTLVNDPDCAYITLPDFYLNLPYSRGLHRIFQRAMNLQGNPTDTEFALSLFPAIGLKTRTARYSGINICWIEGFKVKFYSLYAEPGTANNKIIVQLIVAAPDSVGEDDPLPIMPEMVTKIWDRLAEQESRPGFTATQSLAK